MAKIMILGAGSFGTALATLLNDNNHDVILWCYKSSYVELLDKERENKKDLKGVYIDKKITITSDISMLQDVEYLIIAIPCLSIIDTIKKIEKYINKDIIIINASKGLDKNSKDTFSNTFRKILPLNRYVVISGPSHAEEIARKHITLIVAASVDKKSSILVQKLFNNNYIRVYTSDDILGVELCGALKNIIALSIGIIDGIGMGDNTKAALMTRGLKEISRLGIKMGGKLETFFGISGMGDLIVTCTSVYSRNRRAGFLIGQGIKPEEAIKKVGTVEGYTTIQIAYELSKIYNIDMPIITALYLSLFKNEDLIDNFKKLMLRPYKDEMEFDKI